MSLQTHPHCKFFWTKKAAQASNESPDSWKTQPINKKSIHIVKLTNVNQDSLCTYINNTIIDKSKVVDNTSEDVDETKETDSCTNRGKMFRTRGRMKKHASSNHAVFLKIFSTNAAGLVKGKLDSLKSEVAATQANIVTLQESHCHRKGRVQLPDCRTQGGPA